MKKNLLSISVVALLLACSSDDVSNSNENIIQPISVANESITTFFNAEIPELQNGYVNYPTSKGFFYDPESYGGVTLLKNLVYVINSKQELADVYLGEKELPEIDFDRYTLIIGQQIMPCLGFYVAKKELSSDDNGLVLSLCARNEREILLTAAQNLYFWGLYPKLSQKTVSVTVTLEYPNRPDLQ